MWTTTAEWAHPSVTHPAIVTAAGYSRICTFFTLFSINYGACLRGRRRAPGEYQSLESFRPPLQAMMSSRCIYVRHCCVARSFLIMTIRCAVPSRHVLRTSSSPKPSFLTIGVSPTVAQCQPIYWDRTWKHADRIYRLALQSFRAPRRDPLPSHSRPV